VRRQDREGTFVLYENHVSTGREVPFAPYTVLDLNLHWQHKGFTVFVETNNLFDTAYYDFSNIPQPGRTLKAGFRWSFR
jgi:outer membrane receptor protein involved in Fe transport